MKRIIRPILVLLLVLLMLLSLPAFMEEAETIKGYFPIRVLIWPRTSRAGETLGDIKPYEPVELTFSERHWGYMIMEDGKKGYVYYDAMLPLPECESIPEKQLYSPTGLQVVSLPNKDAPSVGELSAWTFCTVDGVSDLWYRVQLPGGKSGYVPQDALQEPVFTLPEDPAALTVIAPEPAELTGLPLHGAEVTGHSEAGTFFTAWDVGFGDHLALIDGDTVSYIRKEDVCICEIDAASNIPFFRFTREDEAAKLYFSDAYAGPGGTVLHTPGREDTVIPAGEHMFVYMGASGILSVSYGEQSGYVTEDSVTPDTAALKAERIVKTDLAGASVTKNEYLDQAFTMLEEQNSFLLRYNILTDSKIEALFPTGVPYFWGGRSYNVIRRQYPEYTPFPAWQSSPLYYRAGTTYLYGLDCVGFVKAVCTLAGHPPRSAFKDMFSNSYCYDGNHVFCTISHPMPEDWKEVSALMQPGDIMVVYHPGQHVMMYIGTLRQYGYTEEQLPLLADYLDYPLMIQSGEDPYCYLRFTDYILSSDDPDVSQSTPPDGGVGITILGVPREEAEYIIRAPHMDYSCFLVEGSCLNMFDFDRVTDYVVFRQDPR